MEKDLLIDLINSEEIRQNQEINLISSENICDSEVRLFLNSCLVNKYAEGSPGKRFYSGCVNIDKIEKLASDRCKDLFNAEYANLQPHSGSLANLISYNALLKPGDKILAMDFSAGGHLSHGHKLHLASKIYSFSYYSVNKKTHLIDYNEVKRLANEIKPQLIIAGASAYSRLIDYEIFSTIAKSVNAFFMADIAHIAGLIAAKVIPSPLPYADIVTSTTHKTLRGARGAFILSKKEFKEKIERSVTPGIQGGPFLNVIASHAKLFEIAKTENFISYQKDIIKNAQYMASLFKDFGFDVITDGTDTHQFLINLEKFNITGSEAETKLEQHNIFLNKNCIPFDTKSPLIASGIRIGVPFITSQKKTDKEIKEIVIKIKNILLNYKV